MFSEYNNNRKGLELKTILKDRLVVFVQICIVIAFLGGFTAAQKRRTMPSADVYYKRGEAQMNAGKCVNAIRNFNHAIRINPREAKFYLKRGECFDLIDEGRKAIDDFNRAIELKPDFAEAYIGRAIVLATYTKENGERYKTSAGIEGSTDLDNIAAVLADFNKAIKITPNNPAAYIARAKYYFQPLYEYKSALEDFNKAFKINPRNAKVFFERANFYFRSLEDYDSALADINEAIKIAPNDADFYALRAEIYAVGKENYRQAIADYTAALRLDPNNSDFLVERAMLYSQTGQDRLAEADFRRAEKLSEKSGIETVSVPIYRSIPKMISEEELADSYIIIRNVESGSKETSLSEIRRLTKVLEVNPRLVKALFKRGNHYLILRDFEKAAADYTQAMDLDAIDYFFFNNRGIAYAKMGDFEQAIIDFTVANVSNSRENPEVFYNRGLALLNKGDAKESVEDFTQFLKIYEQNINAYRLRAKAYRNLGKTAEAEADEKKVELLRNQ